MTGNNKMELERLSLAPWRSVASQHLQRRSRRLKGFTMDDKQRVLWIHWGVADETNLDGAVRAGEYVELLDLLLRVDRAAGLQELELLLGGEWARFVRRVEEPEDVNAPPPFTIGACVELTRSHVLDDPWIFTPRWTSASHQTFYATRTQLLRAYTTRFGVALDRTANRIPLRVTLFDGDIDDDSVEGAMPLAEVLHLALSTTVYRALAQRPPSSFAIRDVSARLFKTRVTTSDLVTLARLAEQGVSLSDVVLTWLVQEGDDVDMHRSLLRQLLSPSSETHVQQLQVNTRMHRLGMQAISSALVDCQSVRHVCCYFALDHELAAMNVEIPDVRGRFLEWQWLAWALFSAEATHSIERVSIDATTLERADAEAMRQVLTVAHPLALLTHQPQPSSGRLVPQRVRLARGTQITSATGHEIHWSDECTEFRVIHGLENHDGTSETLGLLVPGWGVGTVLKHSTTPVVVSQSNAARSRSAVKELKIHSFTEDPSAILPLLEAVGGQLTYLSLADSEEPLSADMLRSVLRLCPSLTRLRLSDVNVATLQPLIDHMANTSSEIKKLSFRAVKVADMASVHRFLDALCGSPPHDEPPHASSKTLEELSLHIIERTIADPSRGPILKTLASSLETNRRVTRCLAYIASRSRFDQFSPVFKSLDRQLLPVRRAPLPLRSKLAFLSVVQPLTPTVARSVQRLDSLVITQIFRFAGSCVERHCELVLER